MLISIGSAQGEPSGVGAAIDPDQLIRARAPLFITFAILLILSAFAAGSETAIFSLNKLDVIQLRNQPSRSSQALIYLLDHPNGTLITLLTVNNFVNIGLSLTAGALTESYLHGQTAASIGLAALIATSVILVFGEVLPKCVAHIRALNVARVIAWPTAGLAILMAPIRITINGIVHYGFRVFNIQQPKPTDEISEEELEAVIRTGEVSTLLEEDEMGMIEGVFELRHTFAEEIMVPRTAVTSVPDTLSQEEMLARLKPVIYSRVVVYHETLDHPIGFLLIKEVLLNPGTNWREFIREPLMVPVRIRLIDLLKQFRRSASKIALLVDEYGGVAGIVTLHDLLEEIVGDIHEQHETVVAECQQIGEGHWKVNGQMNLEEFAEKVSFEFPEDVATTVGGFMMNTLGRVPTVGSELEYDGLKMKVTRMAGRRIALLEIEKIRPAGPAEAAPENPAEHVSDKPSEKITGGE